MAAVLESISAPRPSDSRTTVWRHPKRFLSTPLQRISLASRCRGIFCQALDTASKVDGARAGSSPTRTMGSGASLDVEHGEEQVAAVASGEEERSGLSERDLAAYHFGSSGWCNDITAKDWGREESLPESVGAIVSRRNAMALTFSSFIFSQVGLHNIALAEPSVGFREYIDTFDGYSFNYPKNWIQVRGAGADIFFRDPFVLDENISMEFSSPSSSKYKSVEDLGPPQEAGEKVLRQYLTEFMSTRLGVRRESNILSTSSRVADDGRIYYQVEVNIKSYANNNELAVMPQDRIACLEWDRRYLSVLGVENNRLYELRLQAPENEFLEEENELRQVMGSFRVNKVAD
ncbi:hypothetical protein HHK36_012204 [Tetracentron sinense]|uniref:PsbP C-terminal domain-containing protein n=1 Tax=Tetracentron sinense TaxID=13715 RepID=A0A834ZCG4_TETSI|nr:hypothetical protein HHK36_012204 [Tetracentron sinense]